MSTNQPPGVPPYGARPGAPQPGKDHYAPPQDPWGAVDPGIASMPTDPIAPALGGYPGLPGPGQGEAWSHAPVGGRYGYVPQPPKRRSKVVVSLAVTALALFGVGIGWWVTKTSGVAAPGPTASSEPTIDPHAIKVGDCIINRGTDVVPRVYVRPCGTEQSYQVVLIDTGADIPEGPEGTFDKMTTGVQVCKGVTYDAWFGSKNTADPAQDVFFCLLDPAKHTPSASATAR